jgi:hypothetical protein
MVIIFFYSAVCKEPGERLLRIVEKAAPGKNIEICRDVATLSNALCRPRDGERIVILLAASGKDFLDIFTLRDLLLDIKIILVLPDSDPDTLSKGHLLRPRFMIECNSDFQQVAGVIKRMIGNKM